MGNWLSRLLMNVHHSQTIRQETSKTPQVMNVPCCFRMTTVVPKVVQCRDFEPNSVIQTQGEHSQTGMFDGKAQMFFLFDDLAS